MDRAEGVLLVAELALKEANIANSRLDEISSAPISKSFVINTNGELVIVYDDGTINVVGLVKGKDGDSGPYIIEGKIDEVGNLILSLSDGRIINSGLVRGENGKDGISTQGSPGRSITSGKIDENGHLILSFTDGNFEDTGKVTLEGEKGEDGIGIDEVKINSSQELEILLTNGKTFNLGKIQGKTGERGGAGNQGIPGKTGKDGLSIKGAPGEKGSIGPSGMNGKDGERIIEIGPAFVTGLKGFEPDRIRMREMVIDGEVCKVLVLE